MISNFHRKEVGSTHGRDRVCNPPSGSDFQGNSSVNHAGHIIAKQEDGNPNKNLKIWKTETAELVQSFVQKRQVGWSLQYTADEKYCARMVTNVVQFYESENLATGGCLFQVLRWGICANKINDEQFGTTCGLKVSLTLLSPRGRTTL